MKSLNLHFIPRAQISLRLLTQSSKIYSNLHTIHIKQYKYNIVNGLHMKFGDFGTFQKYWASVDGVHPVWKYREVSLGVRYVLGSLAPDTLVQELLVMTYFL